MSAPKDSATSTHVPGESLVSRFLLTPLLFISFLVSLFLIDKQTYSKVLSGHGSADSYYHSHQRKMAKREMEDAFHLRNKVLAAMFVISGIGLALIGWGGSKVLHALFPGLRAHTA